MKKLNHILIDVVLVFILKVAGTAMLIDILLQVASRYLPVHASWTDEVGRLLFVWFALLSVALAYAKNMHLYVDILYNRLPKPIQVFLDYFSIVLILAASALLTNTGINLIKIVGAQSSPILHLPMSAFYLSVPVSFGFITLYSIFILIEKLLGKEIEISTEV